MGYFKDFKQFFEFIGVLAFSLFFGVYFVPLYMEYVILPICNFVDSLIGFSSGYLCLILGLIVTLYLIGLIGVIINRLFKS